MTVLTHQEQKIVSGECIHRGNGQDRDDWLELYALGRLPSSEVEKIEEHLLVCDSCRDRLDDVAAFAFSAREALKEMPSEARSAAWPTFSWLHSVVSWRTGLAAASAAAVLMLGIGMYRVWEGGPSAPVAALHLIAGRSISIPVAATMRELNIDFQDAGNVSRVTIVDALGATVWAGAAIHDASRTSVRVQPPLREGDYFARVYTSDGNIVHEYGFRIGR